MAETKVSSKYQVVIPKEDRERAGLHVGQKLMVTVKHGVIKLVPLKTLDELEGFVKGLDATGYREEEDPS
jgi:AbrB family looped-hinge helix DNA binding protein